MHDWPSAPVLHFEGRPLPEFGILVGYAALIQRHDLNERTAIEDLYADALRGLTPPVNADF